MAKKSAQATPSNTSAPAQPETAADVSATEVPQGTSQAITPTADEGNQPDVGNLGDSPLAGAGEGIQLGVALPPQAGDVLLDFELATFTHRIAGQAPKGFYRLGRFWPPEGVEVNREDFDDEQWLALEGEPKLSIKPL